MALKNWVIFAAILLVLPSNILSLPSRDPSRKKLEPLTDEDDVYRLPDDAEPISYEIQLSLPEDVFTSNKFSGVSTMTFKVKRFTKEIKLHASRMTIPANGVELKHLDTVMTLTNTKFESDPTTEILTIETVDILTPGKEYSVKFTYDADLVVDDLFGFYKSSYKNEEGDTKYLATTQFHATHARKAFPCLDEPSFKATFQITLVYPVGYRAFSNTKAMPTTNVFATPGLQKTVFETTPKMSTYLIAFVISEFTCTDGEDIDPGVPFSVCSRIGTEDVRGLAVQVGPKAFHGMEAFTNIRYESSKIGKMNLFAIPDFAVGAMENWGLVTFGETSLLWDEEESSDKYKQQVTTVVSHEISHMWFGDYVTTHWWSDAFLNEGFARFFEYKIAGNINPKWELDRQFVIQEVQSVFQTDAESSALALSAPASTPTQASDRFTDTTYKKGASVFRMVESFMGPLHFQTALGTYLSENRFNTTTPDTLWRVLNRFVNTLPAGQTMETIMNTWVVEPGFPVLEVKSSGNDVIISQSRFLASGTDEKTKWYVPISFSKSSDTQKFLNTMPKAWLIPTEDLVIKDALVDSTWFIINNQQTGYYRVNYDDALWNRIIDGLMIKSFDGIHVLNRAQIVDDLFNLAKVGRITYERMFKFVDFLRFDRDYYPWYSAFAGFGDMLQRTGNVGITKRLSSHILEMMKTLNSSVPFDQELPDDQVYTLKRELVLSWACQLGEKQCVANSNTAFAEYKASGKRPSKNLRTVVYCNALRNSSTQKEDWDFLWQQYVSTKIPTEQATILTALGCATDANILKAYLTASITDNSRIRQQDAPAVFSSVYSGSSAGVDIALDFLMENYKKISQYYKNLNSISSLINGLASRFTVQGQVEKLRQLATNGDLEEALKTPVEQAIVTAEANLKWTHSFERQLEAYFNGARSVTTRIATIVVTAGLLALM